MRSIVIPAKAETQLASISGIEPADRQVPAFAGMTDYSIGPKIGTVRAEPVEATHFAEEKIASPSTACLRQSLKDWLRLLDMLEAQGERI